MSVFPRSVLAKRCRWPRPAWRLNAAISAGASEFVRAVPFYRALTHLSEPASLTEMFVKNTRAGLPSANPGRFVETRREPAFLLSSHLETTRLGGGVGAPR